ncbi:hypothetical protein EVG20_g3210 [Dentipellis fragilis]|uniref:Cullin N-terminal domain-containing protein n=1 Tax=Dentipellis fragilis TaxID=205917 RepID=A0A4Y9Z629_9AGAM|nr:hypothetical protein EVG20_g3210 [Dentipellis fragilis]
MSRPSPLRNSMTDLASITASLPALWDYIEPALDHIFRSPTNDVAETPMIDNSYYMWITAALFNYMQSSKGHARPWADLYERLDTYFANVAQELLLGVPQDQDASALVQYLVSTYTRYATGAAVVHRMLNNLNRHFVKREIDEGRGWLSRIDGSDLDLSVLSGSGRKNIRERHSAELGKRFRTEFLEPLLEAPKSGTLTTLDGGGRSVEPKCRLESAVEELTKSVNGIPEESMHVAKDVAHMLKMCGVQPDHLVRKLLDDYTGSVTLCYTCGIDWDN